MTDPKPTPVAYVGDVHFIPGVPAKDHVARSVTEARRLVATGLYVFPGEAPVDEPADEPADETPAEPDEEPQIDMTPDQGEGD